MTLEGPLNKWTNHFHGWQYRYFVLDINKGVLAYYLFKEHVQKGEMRGCIRLDEAFVGYDKDDDILFTITVGEGETFHLQASNLAEKEKWVSWIEKAIILSHSRSNSVEEKNLKEDKDTRLSHDEILVHADKFDSTVTELDTYLQLLIEQNSNLEIRYIALKSPNNDKNSIKTELKETHSNDFKISSEIYEISTENPEISNHSIEYVSMQLENNESQVNISQNEVEEDIEKEKKNIESMLESTKTLIETIKHSIVCLQIAKVNCDPRNGLHTNNDLQQVLSFFNTNKDTNSKSDEIFKIEPRDSSNSSNNSASNNHTIPNTLAKSGTLTVLPLSSKNRINNRKNMLGNNNIPFKSFTTSDDEDNEQFPGTDDDNESFYDAVSSGGENDGDDSEIENIDISKNVEVFTNEISATEVFVKTRIDVNDHPRLKIVVSDSEDEEFEEDELDVNSQSSVITHLLTQVRIGMDLTKITLPTFILETRSLLEMYADFFAVTELFLKIPDIKCPHERMIQVVRWYMSTFRAGRKSPVAKKPYNPILGEIFQCWYNLPNASDFEKKDIIEDGPVPWATNDQLTFVAEQVSHHPPISAFYAEHVDKRVQLEGYTWTKSSFLGLSIAVHMVGKAVLTLLDLDEEYVMTFPSAYGRSILGVPWFEMGGTVQIECLKTGYQSTIQFLTKPFYGGKKHQISGTICGPDKKVLNNIDGDWNGTMLLKTVKKIEILINTQSMSTIHKQTRKLKEQCDFESRKIWKDVTYNLRSKQIEAASLGKQRIEQMQREGVKKRKEENLKWENRYFIENGENWNYVNPLKKRLQISNVENNFNNDSQI